MLLAVSALGETLNITVSNVTVTALPSIAIIIDAAHFPVIIDAVVTGWASKGSKVILSRSPAVISMERLMPVKAMAIKKLSVIKLIRL